MGNLIAQISGSKRLNEKEDERSTDLSTDGKKANKEISQLGFSLIKDMINTGDELNNTDVNDYLDKADAINDEVDTVVFGLETDDNEIVKVYVAVTDADAFEKAMGEKLGTEDDIEDVIAELAQEYDIVDVEWPEGHDDEDESSDDEEEPETQNSKGEESTEAEAELNFDEPIIAKEHTEDHMTTFGERFKARIIATSLTEAKKDEKVWPKEVESFAKSLTNPSQEAILYLITLFNLPREVIGSKKAIGQFRRNIIASGREYAKNQTLKIWINKLTKELDPNSKKDDDKKVAKGEEEPIKEAKKEKEDLAPEWDDPKLEKGAKFRETLPRGVPRLIFDVLISLGVPEVMLAVNKSKVRNTLRELTYTFRRTQRLRIYLNLIADAFGVTKDDQTETARSTSKVTEEEEILDEAVAVDDFVVIVKEVLTKLGIPSVNLNYKTSIVTRSIKAKKMNMNYAALIPKLEVFLDWVTKAEHNKPPVVQEATSADYDMYVKELAIALGIPADNLSYKEQTVVQSLRQRKAELNWSTLVTRIKKLIGYIESISKKQESIIDITKARLAEQKRLAEMVTTKMKKDDTEIGDDEVSKILKKGSKAEKETPKDDGSADVGRWNFSSLGSAGFTMRARGVKLQFEDIVAERIAKALGDGKAATVKTTTSERVVFSPRDRGNSYVVAGIEKFENGVKMSSKDIDNLLDTLGGK